MLDERSGVAVEPLEVAVVIIPPQGVRKGGAGREARCEDSPPLGRKAGKCSVAQWIAHGAGDGATDRALRDTPPKPPTSYGQLEEQPRMGKGALWLKSSLLSLRDSLQRVYILKD